MTDDAVSEVVGVMIMLVVTILLVSIVGASASGLIGDNKTPVSAELVFAGCNDDKTKLIFENVAGDAFPLKRMKLVLGVRDDVQNRSVLTEPDITSDRETTAMMVGDRISISLPEDFSVAEGEYLTYQFYDIDAGVLVSSGEIPGNLLR